MNTRGLICILFAAASWLSACAAYAAAENYQKVLVLSPGGKASDNELCRNITVAFKNLKMNFKVADSASHEAGEEIQKLGKDDLLVITAFTAEDLSAVVSYPKIMRYVSEGGKLFIPHLGAEGTLSKIAGVKTVRDPLTVSGFKPLTKLFPGLETCESGIALGRYEAMGVELVPNAAVLARSDENSPLAWKYDFGKGKVIAFNSNMLGNAGFCGVMVQLASMLDDYFITTVSNAKVIFIDDFPFPIPTGSEYVITSNYDGMSYEEFYKEVWWPQVKALADKYKLKYTCLVLTNYQNSVEMPPLPITDKMKEFISYFGKDIIKSGHELGIHGFNHGSLLMAEHEAALKAINYSPWKSEKDMEAGLTYLKKTLDEALGKIDYFTYVPPMNMMSKEGKRAVLNVFPGIRCIASLSNNTLFVDSSPKEDGELKQELGPDPDFPQVYGLPRFSFGEVYKTDEMWTVYNYIAYCGLFSHFFHPDDLMDAERSANLDWKGLYESFGKIVGGVSEKFPFLRGMTAKEFVLERFRTDKIKVYSHREGNVITVEYAGGDGPLYHYLRINNGMKVGGVKNGSFSQIGDIGGLYIVEGLKSPVQITLEQGGGK